MRLVLLHSLRVCETHMLTVLLGVKLTVMEGLEELRRVVVREPEPVGDTVAEGQAEEGGVLEARGHTVGEKELLCVVEVDSEWLCETLNVLELLKVCVVEEEKEEETVLDSHRLGEGLTVRLVLCVKVVVPHCEADPERVRVGLYDKDAVPHGEAECVEDRQKVGEGESVLVELMVLVGLILPEGQREVDNEREVVSVPELLTQCVLLRQRVGDWELEVHWVGEMDAVGEVVSDRVGEGDRVCLPVVLSVTE